MPGRVVAQRLLGQAGVTWLVILDRRLDPADPVIKAELQTALAELRAVTGVEHAAGAEPCWRAVREDRAGRQAAQLLTQPTPPGLADRVAFAVEVAAAAGAPAQRQSRLPARRPPSGRRGWRRPRPAKAPSDDGSPIVNSPR